MAVPGYPGVVADHLKLAKAPDCSLCHVGARASGTVNTLFGTSMRERGLVKYNDASVRTALDALRAEKKDSNGDGQGDIDTLIAGGDPNAAFAGADGGTEVVGPPEYGCANVSGSPTSLSSAALVFLAGLVALRRRRSA
jgi:MYXO-CTERM domain-containing protein